MESETEKNGEIILKMQDESPIYIHIIHSHMLILNQL